jgi:hypothetical protein
MVHRYRQHFERIDAYLSRWQRGLGWAVWEALRVLSVGAVERRLARDVDGAYATKNTSAGVNNVSGSQSRAAGRRNESHAGVHDESFRVGHTGRRMASQREDRQRVL